MSRDEAIARYNVARKRLEKAKSSGHAVHEEKERIGAEYQAALSELTVAQVLFNEAISELNHALDEEVMQ